MRKLSDRDHKKGEDPERTDVSDNSKNIAQWFDENYAGKWEL